MSRSFSAYHLISLPRLSAPTALALGTELVTAFRLQGEPPAALAKGAERLEGSLEALRSSRQRLLDAQKLDAGAAFAADLRLDAGWAALYLLLQAWAKLPDRGPGADGVGRARHLIEIIFPQGLSFTQAPYKIEWAESQMRLDRLGEPENADHVRALGGESFVAEIREAYEAYGEALQITARRAEAKAVRVREPLDEVVTALRRYVLAVAAYADERDDDEAARALAEALLAPLAAWQSPRRRKGRGGGRPTDEIGEVEPTGDAGRGERNSGGGRHRPPGAAPQGEAARAFIEGPDAADASPGTPGLGAGYPHEVGAGHRRPAKTMGRAQVGGLEEGPSKARQQPEQVELRGAVGCPRGNSGAANARGNGAQSPAGGRAPAARAASRARPNVAVARGVRRPLGGRSPHEPGPRRGGGLHAPNRCRCRAARGGVRCPRVHSGAPRPAGSGSEQGRTVLLTPPAPPGPPARLARPGSGPPRRVPAWRRGPLGRPQTRRFWPSAGWPAACVYPQGRPPRAPATSPRRQPLQPPSIKKLSSCAASLTPGSP
ncbi:MAG TPA: hypothetical protein VFS43_05450 [Polyangiaceae bacterium]|nr:hypothetical protein [Polyangiaceae bacterium]